MKQYMTVVIVIGSLGFSTVAWGDKLTVHSDNRSAKHISRFADIGVTGAKMVGIGVQVKFQDGTVRSKSWHALGANVGGVQGSDWFLTQGGDTFAGDLLGSPPDVSGFNWKFSNNSLQGVAELMIDASMGNVVFDVMGEEKTTPESGFGTPFNVLDTQSGLDIQATYLNPVIFNGTVPQSDLYTGLRVEFRNAGGLSSGTSLNFSIDTDMVVLLAAGDGNSSSNPGSTPVPEPQTFLLLLTGVAGLGAAKFRLKAHSSL